MATITSVGGLLALLEEPSVSLQHYGLTRLNSVVDQFWSEISDSLTRIEILYEEEDFPYRKLAALLLAKIYYNLGEYDEALGFALGADDLFDQTEGSLFVKTIVNTAVESYIHQRESATATTKIDPRLQAVVENMVERCFQANEYKMVIGIALEARRLDLLEKALKLGNTAELFAYLQDSCFPLLQHMEARHNVLNLMLRIQMSLPESNYEAISQCLMQLNEPETCAHLLLRMTESERDEQTLVIYQVAFDLEEDATQEFLGKVIHYLDHTEYARPTEGDEFTKFTTVINNLKSIFSGKQTIKLVLDFLFQNNHTDLAILKNTRDRLESRSSVFHSAMTLANAYMHAGTTVDDFLRSNMEWLARATNWTKFTAAASLGVIHKGQIERGPAIMARYLPQDGVSNSPYSEGGAFFALGLINANHGGAAIDYLTNALTSFQTRDVEILQHGACLGLGAAGMATADENLFDSLKNVLYTDSAVAAEAAGLAMGLVMVGTASQSAIDEMLQYAHETQHEKIIRGLAIGMAFIMYGRQDQADDLIDKLSDDKDPILRYGAMYMIAMAYCGTGNNSAIKRLLHIAVSDVNDDVRRAAVTALGFILFRTPSQVPRMVQLLSESYNPHVRYGATLALGISCAGTGSKEAINLLEPMTRDSADHVRQGALIALAMIQIEQSEAANPKVAATRKLYSTIIADKHEDPMTKFGATLAQGIIDAGGRNVTISLQTRSGHTRMPAVVGMALFTQFWFWYPLAHFLPLAFTPTAFIGLDQNLRVPKMTIVSNARKALFAYPEPIPPPAADVAVRVATAVLSTTAKTKARAKKAEREKERQRTGSVKDSSASTAMDTDEAKPTANVTSGSKVGDEDGSQAVNDTAMDTDEASTAKAKVPSGDSATASKKFEPISENLPNLCRVVPAQWRHISFPADARYVPVKRGALTGGIIMLDDLQPDQPQELMASVIPRSHEGSGSELQLPKPFEYPFGDDD
ncbi:armadillo-type protein [Dimargaris cristalligena]|uniref:26S proteasome regulatory subunit RPN2 n=1 Tax=Dimargaris cristalligena TaxID=215637 RepID=A0A4P9ZS49_9FUNG|nr:armadillo-type protein [Dimargaris cristalligena]|eukprot:RKP35290.1 armadillo-type protein [Dimargaris cristalligena]